MRMKKNCRKFISVILAVLILVSILYSGNSVQAEGRGITEVPDFQDITVSKNGVVKFVIGQGINYDYYYGDEYSENDYVDDDDYYDYYDEEDYYDSNPEKYELYRSSEVSDGYEMVASGTLENDYSAKISDKTAAIGSVYYYKVRYTNSDGTVCGEFNNVVKVGVVPDPGKIKNVRATGKKTLTVKWKTVSNVDGYNIYYKEVDEEMMYGLHYFSKYESDGISYYEDGAEKKPYKFYKSVSASAKSVKFNKSKHGKGYLIKLKSYKLVDGKKVESVRGYVGHGVQDYYYCPNAENTKYKLVWPKSVSQGNKWAKKMTVIAVKTWDYKNHEAHKGAKYTKTLYIQVNKKYAPTIKQIFKEIYKNKTKPPIYEAGSFRWGEDELGYYHCQGVAIDMNVNENPMFKRVNGKITKKAEVGSFYKPKTNPYSFPRNGVVENTFRKYGFYRLNHDLMHFEAHGNCGSCNY